MRFAPGITANALQERIKNIDWAIKFLVTAALLLGGSRPRRAFCSPRRCGVERIFRPRMFRVASAHFRAHGAVAAAPESGQIARHLLRALCRRKELDQERDLSAGDRRMLR